MAENGRVSQRKAFRATLGDEDEADRVAVAIALSRLDEALAAQAIAAQDAVASGLSVEDVAHQVGLDETTLRRCCFAGSGRHGTCRSGQRGHRLLCQSLSVHRRGRDSLGVRRGLRVPLVAEVDGERRVSVLLSDGEWVDLQQQVRKGDAVVTMVGCGSPGYPRTSRLGTRHFAHRAKSDCGAHGPESAQHLLAKALLVQAATGAGWLAQPEVAGDGWVADVLATRESTKVAFEVQWSRQTADEYRLRQERYRHSGVRCAWFARHTASVPPAAGELPVFLLVASDEGGLGAKVGDQLVALGEAATMLLTGRVKFRGRLGDGRPASVEVTCRTYDCYRCRKPYLIWSAARTKTVGACGHREETFGYSDSWAQTKPEAAPAVREGARNVAIAHKVALGTLEPTYTKTTQSTYMAFGCPNCRAVLGDWFLRGFLLEAAYDEPLATFSAPGSTEGLEHPHWCLDIGAGHCVGG